MRPGPPCKLCNSPKAAKIAEAFARGDSVAKVAKAFKLPNSTVGTHRKHVARVLEVAEPKPLPAGASAQDQAVWHMQRIEERMKAAEKAPIPNEKEIATLYGQYTNAMRHHAKVSGALDITEAAVVRSAPFVKVRAIIERALEKHPAAYKAVQEAIVAAIEGR